MAVFTFADLDKKVEDGYASTCISVNGARIIIPTACDEKVGFTNPDDLDVDLLARWKNGERGPEFENQQLQPGDCLVMYNNGRNINEVLAQNPDWYKSVEGIKDVIDRLYACAAEGGKNTEPAIWNSDLRWAKGVHLATTSGKEITDDVWKQNAGVALEAIKSPVEQNFIHMKPGDKLVSPDGRIQTAGAMSAIAVQQPGGNWNIVQLNAKGYAVVKENIRVEEQGKKKGLRGYLELKSAKLDKASEQERAMREAVVDNAIKEGKKQGKSELEVRREVNVQDLRDAESKARSKKLAEILKARFKKGRK